MKKLIMTVAMMALLSGVLFASGGVEVKAVKIGAFDARNLIDKGNVILVDVRTAEEFEAGHIPGAILIPNESIKDKPPLLLPNLETPVMVYCRTGRRSAEAAEKLLRIGYVTVYDLGGIVDWPYETITER